MGTLNVQQGLAQAVICPGAGRSGKRRGFAGIRLIAAYTRSLQFRPSKDGSKRPSDGESRCCGAARQSRHVADMQNPRNLGKQIAGEADINRQVVDADSANDQASGYLTVWSQWQKHIVW